MEEKFEEFVNRGQDGRCKEERRKSADKQKTGSAQRMLSWPNLGTRHRSLEQAIDAGREIAVTGQQRRVEKWQARG